MHLVRMHPEVVWLDVNPSWRILGCIYRKLWDLIRQRHIKWLNVKGLFIALPCGGEKEILPASDSCDKSGTFMEEKICKVLPQKCILHGAMLLFWRQKLAHDLTLCRYIHHFTHICLFKRDARLHYSHHKSINRNVWQEQWACIHITSAVLPRDNSFSSSISSSCRFYAKCWNK